jgi:hypothetical protein
MVWDFTIKLTDIAIVVAALLGPVLAVQAQKWLERKRDGKERQLAIFRTLMSTRAAILSPQHVEALNAVPVEFYGTSGTLKSINDAWKLYLDHLNDRNFPSDAWGQKRFELLMDLLHLLSQFLNFSFSRAQLSRDIYSPTAHGELESDQTIIRKGLVSLFSEGGALPLVVKEVPTAAPGEAELQAALQKVLTEVLQGKQPLAITDEK